MQRLAPPQRKSWQKLRATPVGEPMTVQELAEAFHTGAWIAADGRIYGARVGLGALGNTHMDAIRHLLPERLPTNLMDLDKLVNRVKAKYKLIPIIVCRKIAIFVELNAEPTQEQTAVLRHLHFLTRADTPEFAWNMRHKETLQHGVGWESLEHLLQSSSAA